ncbi:hypothetical protein OROGR_016574 [Orobanche gracilis]
MSDVVAPAHNDNEVAHVSSDAQANEHDLQFLRDAVRTTPPQILKDLLSNGFAIKFNEFMNVNPLLVCRVPYLKFAPLPQVCTRCIYRLFILHESICCPSLPTRILSAILHELTEHEGDGANIRVKETEVLTDIDLVHEIHEDIKFCSVCLGILQYVYNDDKGMLVKKNHANDFAAAIGDVVKKEGHQCGSFSLEVSVPPIVVENEQAVWSYAKKKYGSLPWFQEKNPSESISVKDFLKFSVASPLEKLLDVKSNGSSFRIHLTYTLSNESLKEQPVRESNGCYKRRKVDDIDSMKNSAGLRKLERYEPTRSCSVGSEDDGIGFLTSPIEKVNQCCSLNFQCYKTQIFVGGRYLKYSRNVSQTRWIIDDERMGEASVEEIVGGQILPICQGDSYKFHAAGREDIDVRMLGTGRPFLIEIQNARQFPSDVLIKDIEIKINSLESKFVRVKNLKFLGNQGWELMREGEAEKQKQYAALVWISRPLNSDDKDTLSSLRDMKILQKTPVRVLHRRSPLEREKTIHWMRIERIAGRSHYFLLHLCTQAGTYIKEFVHGDLGRTHPSVGSILGCRAEILQLDVTDVKMDCFQA